MPIRVEYGFHVTNREDHFREKDKVLNWVKENIPNSIILKELMNINDKESLEKEMHRITTQFPHFILAVSGLNEHRDPLWFIFCTSGKFDYKNMAENK